MKKRRKLYHFHNMIEDGLDFFDSMRVANDEGKKGCRYILSNKLSEEQKAKLSKYDNVIFSNATYRYAPEIKYDAIILLD